MPNKNEVGIVIVNWRSKGIIFNCLEAIKRVGYLESVVVVDNDSKDGSVGELRTKYKELRTRILENKKNLGFAGGNNRGIRYWLERGVEYILILNPDTFVSCSGSSTPGEYFAHPRGVLRQFDTISLLHEVMERDKNIGIAGPKILLPKTSPSPLLKGEGNYSLIWSAGGILDKKRFSGGLIGLGQIDNGQYDKIKEVDFISGTAMMVKREVFEKVGFFNEDYFIYYEDVELNVRAKKAGFKLMLVPNSVIIHHESSSMGKNSPSQEYYLARNHLLFVERNAPVSINLRELIRLPKTIYEHWKRGEKWAVRGIRDYIMRRFGKI